MKLYLFLSLAFAFILFAAFKNSSPTIIYVMPGGPGNGGSWKHATHDLAGALKKAKNGTEIWVAQGIYFPTEGDNRSAAFELANGVAIYGGFNGTESALSERKVTSYPTVLSGNIGNSDPYDNSYNVVRLRGSGASTIIDGFIITGGYADAKATEGHPNRSGGGIYIDGAKFAARPQIRGCIFIGNFAKDGGAVYNFGRAGDASPAFLDCEFASNNADLDGGAVNNDGRDKGRSCPSFRNCLFDSNQGNYGGAIFCQSVNGDSVPLIENCTFQKNKAHAKGGAIFHLTNVKGSAPWLPDGQVFQNNQAYHQESADYGYVGIH